MVSNFPVYSGTGKVPYMIWKTLKEEGLAEANYFLTHRMNRHDHDLPEYRAEGIRVLQPFDYRVSPVLSRFMLFFVDPYLLPKGYDVYHFGNHMIARFAKFRRPAVVTVHDVLQFRYPEKLKGVFTSSIYNYFMLQSVKSLVAADHLICVSNWSKGELLKQFSLIDPSKISVVYNGLDHNLFQTGEKREARVRLNLPQDKKIILHLGSEIPRKQVPLLLNAFNEVKKFDSQTILLRHGEKKKESEQLIKELGLEDAIIYRDGTMEAVLPDYYRAADLMVITSSEEGFCLPAIEAMACGLPVVSTTLTSLSEVLGGAQASTIHGLTVGAVVEAIVRVLKMSDEELDEIRKRGLTNAARFSWEKTARETLEVYNKVVRVNS